MKRLENSVYLTSGKPRRNGIGTFIDILLRHAVTIGLTTAIVLAIGITFSVLSEPVYQARILVKIDDTPGNPNGGGRDILSNVSPSLDAKSSAESEIQILGSKRVVSPAVDDLKLYINARPHYFPVIGSWISRISSGLSTPGLFGHGGYAWGKESIDVGAMDVPPELQGAGFRLTALGDGGYFVSSASFSGSFTGKVGTRETFQTPLGPVSLLVNKLTGEPGVEFDVQRFSRQDAIENLQKGLKIAEEGTKSNVLSVSLQGSNPAKISATVDTIGKEYVRQSADRKAIIAASSLDFLEGQKPRMKQQVDEAESRYNAYRNNHGILDVEEESRLALRNIAETETQLAQLNRSRSALAARFGRTHPDIVAMDAQIRSTQDRLDELNQRVKEMPVDEQGAQRLNRDVRVSTSLYTALLNNIEELKLIRAGKTGPVQLIDEADTPNRPIRPVKSLIVFASALLGLFLGIAIALIREHVFSGVTEPEQIESEANLNVFAMIPYSGKQRDMVRQAGEFYTEQSVLANRYPQDATIESLRSFRSALQFAILSARNNVVMLTGPLPGVGKSFVTANLASVLAAAGKRVLLVDADLRKGHLNKAFGCPPGPGLTDLLYEPESFDAVVRKDILPNLDFIQTGVYPPNPSELLMGDAFRTLMRSASERYDIVLIDSPPVLAVSDTGIMAPVASSIFLVARFAQTRIGEIEESIKRFAQTGARVNGVLLNGFSLHRTTYTHASRYGSKAYEAHHYGGGTVAK